MRQVITIVAGVLISTAAFAQDSLNVSRIWQMHAWSYANGIASRDTLAFVATDMGLKVFNIANPSRLELVGNEENSPVNPQDLAISGDYAYVANGENGLRIVDISDPSAPAGVGPGMLPAYACEVAVAGNYVYVADCGCGLRIFNVSDPDTPVEAGSWTEVDGASGVAVSGNFLYLAASWSDGLIILDITNPVEPVAVGEYDTPGTAVDVAVRDSLAYVADDLSLRIIDVSEPSQPTEVGFYPADSCSIGSVQVRDSYAYLGTWGRGLIILNITNPAAPLEAGECPTDGGATDVAVSGGIACVSDYNMGVRVIDVANVEDPVAVGGWDTMWRVDGVTVNGDYAYVMEMGIGFSPCWMHVFDISSPAAPREISDTWIWDWCSHLEIGGNYVYVAGGSGLWVLDVSDPAEPRRIGHCSTRGAQDVAVRDTLAYIADADSGLKVISVADTSALSILGSCDTPGWAEGIALSGSFAYVADGDSGLRIMDISDPTVPVEVSNVPSQYAFDVAVSGNYACVADSNHVQIIDVSNPTAPVEAGSYDTPGVAWHVTVSNDYAYVASRSGGLRVLDLSDPAAPVESGYYDTPGEAQGVAAAGTVAYVADLDYFGIYDVSQIVGVPPRTPRVPSMFALHAAYPNPFNAVTTITFDLPKAGKMMLRVFDLLGREVAVLKDGVMEAGSHRVTFDGSDMASGMYFVRMEAGEFVQTRNLVLLK